MKIIVVAGARPNFMKIAPIMHAFNNNGSFESLLVHTGQHYDKNMSDLFFHELNIPEPDINLEVRSGSHAVQTAEIMKRFEPIVNEHKPDYVLVVGDVNSTIACGLVAVKLGVKLIHVEAGLRSFDRRMPEEINRVLTDSISDLLFISEPSGVENLKKEGIPDDKVHFVGNVMIDTLLANKKKAEQSSILDDLGISKSNYSVVTLHRPSNVDDKDSLDIILSAFEEIQNDKTLVFPIHPRTRSNIDTFGFTDRVEAMEQLKLIEPIGYLDFLWLLSNASVVLTDSGGIQEETTILGVPCLTLRENTERPVTITSGTNRLVALNPESIVKAYNESVSSGLGSFKQPELWDGKASDRIVSTLTALHC